MERTPSYFPSDRSPERRGNNRRRRLSGLLGPTVSPATQESDHQSTDSFSIAEQGVTQEVPVSVPEYGYPTLEQANNQQYGYSDSVEAGLRNPEATETTRRDQTIEPVRIPDVSEEEFNRMLVNAGLGDLNRPIEELTTELSPDAQGPEPTSSESFTSQPLSAAERAPKTTIEQRRLANLARVIIIAANHLAKNQARLEGERVREEFNDRLEGQGRHVRHDAWKSFVEDDQGRLISTPEEYGEAFNQERRQEIRQQASIDTQQVSSIPTSTAQPVSSATDAAIAPPRLPDGLTTPELPNGESLRRDPQHLLPATTKTGLSLLLSPWVWLLVGLLLLIFFGISLSH